MRRDRASRTFRQGRGAAARFGATHERDPVGIAGLAAAGMLNGMRHAIAALFVLSACAGDETLTKYAPGAGAWRLSGASGAPADGGMTLRFPTPGRVAGRTPCSRFTARISAPYPWFELDDIEATPLPCAGGHGTAPLLEALRAMSIAEISDDTLILSTPEGARMVFTAQP